MALSAPEPLCASHETAAFSCGKPALDRWLKTRALSNQEKGFTAVMVVHEARRVIGYYGWRRRPSFRTFCLARSEPGSHPIRCRACCWASLQQIPVGQGAASAKAYSNTRSGVA